MNIRIELPTLDERGAYTAASVRRMITAAVEHDRQGRGEPIDVDDLAQEIRRVDGWHGKGAGALAEALMPFLTEHLAPQPAEPMRMPTTWTRQKLLDVAFGLENSVPHAQKEATALLREIAAQQDEPVKPGLGPYRDIPEAGYEHRKPVEPVDWQDAQRIAELPEVDEILTGFVDNPTGDNGVMVVRAVMQAVRQQPAEPVKFSPETCDQIAAVMLQTGTPEQQAEALRYCGIEPVKDGRAGEMTPRRAAFFLERFKRDEKMLGPNEQWALEYAIETLEAEPVKVPSVPTATLVEQILGAIHKHISGPILPGDAIAAAQYIATRYCNATTAAMHPEADEDAYVIDRMSKLLAEIAVIVRGPEPSCHRHGYADLPERVASLKAAKAAQPAASAEPDVVLRVVHSDHEVEDPEVVKTSGRFDNLPAGTEVRLYTAPVVAQPDRYKAAYDEWMDKTEFISRRNLPVKYLGWHRADIFRDLIERPAAGAELRSVSDVACAWSVWWNHNKSKFTTPRQASLAAYQAACTANPAAAQPSVPDGWTRQKLMDVAFGLDSGVQYACQEAARLLREMVAPTSQASGPADMGNPISLEDQSVTADGQAQQDALDQVELAAATASAGHLSALLDVQTSLLNRAMNVMKALHNASSPTDEGMGNFDATIPYGDFTAFVDAHAALLHDISQSPVADPAQQDADRLNSAYESGWRNAARWASRDDLIADIGSPAYEVEKRQAVGQSAKQGGQS